MIQKVLEKFWKYIGSKRKKGKNIVILCNGEQTSNSRKIFEMLSSGFCISFYFKC